MTQGSGDSSIAEVERLVGRIEASPNADTTAETRELVRGVLAFHREGLARIVEILRAARKTEDPNEAPLSQIAADPAVSALLVLHGLHPHSIEARARAAIEKLRATHANLELLDVREDTIYLRLPELGAIGPLISKMIEAELAETVPDAVAVRFVEPEMPLLQLRRKDSGK